MGAGVGLTISHSFLLVKRLDCRGGGAGLCVVMHDGGGVGSLYYSDILFSLPRASDALYKVTLMDWLVNGQFVRPAAALTPYMSTQPGWELSISSGGKNCCLVIYIHYQLAVVPTER